MVGKGASTGRIASDSGGTHRLIVQVTGFGTLRLIRNPLEIRSGKCYQ